jgi:hypothetical protein
MQNKIFQTECMMSEGALIDHASYDALKHEFQAWKHDHAAPSLSTAVASNESFLVPSADAAKIMEASNDRIDNAMIDPNSASGVLMAIQENTVANQVFIQFMTKKVDENQAQNDMAERLQAINAHAEAEGGGHLRLGAIDLQGGRQVLSLHDLNSPFSDSIMAEEVAQHAVGTRAPVHTKPSIGNKRQNAIKAKSTMDDMLMLKSPKSSNKSPSLSKNGPLPDENTIPKDGTAFAAKASKGESLFGADLLGKSFLLPNSASRTSVSMQAKPIGNTRSGPAANRPAPALRRIGPKHGGLAGRHHYQPRSMLRQQARLGDGYVPQYQRPRPIRPWRDNADVIFTVTRGPAWGTSVVLPIGAGGFTDIVFVIPTNTPYRSVTSRSTLSATVTKTLTPVRSLTTSFTYLTTVATVTSRSSISPILYLSSTVAFSPSTTAEALILAPALFPLLFLFFV